MELNLNTIEGWLMIAFFAVAFIQLIYYWLVFSRFAFYKTPPSPQPDFPISVVISAKNEYHNLKRNLPLILNQNYPNFEVVVVNDASDDESIFLLEDLAHEYSKLKVITIQQDLNFFKGKKFPLSVGIKSAKYEHLLLTDADCVPVGPDWIREMAGGFTGENEIVLGYGQYSQKKGFLNMVIRYETAFAALNYFSLALWGMPYMGVGRNLAYKKSLFIKNKGFISHYKVSSGDDDLFINAVAGKKNTTIVASHESFTRSGAKRSFLHWWRQKRRHLSAGMHYKFKHKIILGGYAASFILMLAGVVWQSVVGDFLLIVALFFLIRLLSQMIIFKNTFYRLGEKKLLLISPLIELYLTLIFPVMVFVNLLFKEGQWK
jgi:cellulose synthase/poly-beta-1,6-N-acetylglucosamine synthase-like glycosyltransferase